jgi:hypothetical protein
MLCFSVLPESFSDKFWIFFFEKCQKLELKTKISNDKLCNKVFKTLFS